MGAGATKRLRRTESEGSFGSSEPLSRIPSERSLLRSESFGEAKLLHTLKPSEMEPDDADAVMNMIAPRPSRFIERTAQLKGDAQNDRRLYHPPSHPQLPAGNPAPQPPPAPPAPSPPSSIPR